MFCCMILVLVVHVTCWVTSEPRSRTRETPDIQKVEKLASVPGEQLQAEHQKLFGMLGHDLMALVSPFEREQH